MTEWHVMCTRARACVCVRACSHTLKIMTFSEKCFEMVIIMVLSMVIDTEFGDRVCSVGIQSSHERLSVYTPNIWVLYFSL